MNQLVQDKANSPATLTNGAQATLAAEKRELAKRWFLVSPAMIIIGLAGLAPLTIIPTTVLSLTSSASQTSLKQN